jgi:hypothetical protein
MSTVLTTAINYGSSAIEQKVNRIEIDLEQNKIYIEINDIQEDGIILSRAHHSFKIFDDEGVVIIPANIETEAKDLHRVITAAAIAQGWIQDGITTDDI